MSEKTDSILGAGAGFGTYLGIKILGDLYFPVSRKFGGNFSNGEKILLKEAVKDSFNSSGLKEKGFSLVHVDSNNIKNVFKNVSEMFLSKSAFTKDVLKNNLENILDTVAKAENVCVKPGLKTIFVNLNERADAVFHEMGHIVNNTGKGFAKVLNTLRGPCSFLVPAFLLIGLFKNKKNNEEKPEGFFDKTTDFIKNNAGKLSFIALIPKILEEGMASINGAKMAKKVLSPDLLKKINRKNFFAWSTYLVGSILTSFGISIGIKIRDKVVEKRNQK